jgi:hypothetical protein
VTRLRNNCKFLILVALLFTSMRVIHGQSQFGSIVGTVTDSTGSALTDATVHATNEDSRLGFSTVTRDSGDYTIGGLLPGLYTIEVQKDGFESKSVVHVLSVAGIPTREDISMPPGSVTQDVVVNASAVPLSTESGTIVSQLSPVFLHAGTLYPVTQMPGDTLVAHTAGVFYVGSGRNMSAFGSRGYDRRETLDGAVFGIVNTVSKRMPRDSIADVQSVTLIADSEHETSLSTEMLSAKGTNDLHGTLWTEIQNGALNQARWTSQPGTHTPGIPSLGAGYVFGGPVVIPKLYDGRDKTFFFSTFEKFHETNPITASGTGASNAMRTGDFSGLGITIKDPTTQQPFPNDMIPGDRISTQAQNIYDSYYPSIPGLFHINNFALDTPQLLPLWDLFLRGDHQIGSNDLLSVTYLHNQLAQTFSNGEDYGGPNTTGNDLLDYHLNFFNISENHIFTPTLMNEANFGVMLGVNQVEQSTIDGNTITTTLGLPVPTGAPSGIKGGPTFAWTGFSGLNWGTQNTSGASIWTFRDNLSKEFGISDLKVGFEFVEPNSNTNTFSNVFGTYSYSGLFSGNAIADYLLGLPSSTSEALPPGPVNVTQHELGFYGTETVHLARRLTINAGLRFDYETPAVETHGKYSNFDLKTGDVVVPNTHSLSLLPAGLPSSVLSSVVTAQQAKFPTHLVNPFWYVTPRLGVAYRIDDKTEARVGFGIYPTLLTPGAPTGGIFNPGTKNFVNTNNCSDGTCTPGFTFANPFPASAQAAASGLALTGTNPNWHAPRMYEWELSVERRLSNSMVARLTYGGSHSSQLPYRRNANLPPASTTPFSQSRLIYPQWLSVTYADSGGNQSFDGLDAELKSQLSRSLNFDINYAWSKCITDDDELTAGLSNLGNIIEDPYNRARDKGNCVFVPRQIIRSTFVLTSPFGSGARWLSSLSGADGGLVNTVLGGWNLSGMFQAAPGQYITPEVTGVTSPNTGQTLIRPDRICSGNHPANHSLVFDPTCFVAPPNGRYGNAGTGIILTPGYWQFDSGIYKYVNFAKDARAPKLRMGLRSTDIFGYQPRTIQGPTVVTNVVGAGVVNNVPYTDGTSANLGMWRHVYVEFRLEW